MKFERSSWTGLILITAIMVACGGSDMESEDESTVLAGDAMIAPPLGGDTPPLAVPPIEEMTEPPPEPIDCASDSAPPPPSDAFSNVPVATTGCALATLQRCSVKTENINIAAEIFMTVQLSQADNLPFAIVVQLYDKKRYEDQIKNKVMNPQKHPFGKPITLKPKQNGENVEIQLPFGKEIKDETVGADLVAVDKDGKVLAKETAKLVSKINQVGGGLYWCQGERHRKTEYIVLAKVGIETCNVMIGLDELVCSNKEVLPPKVTDLSQEQCSTEVAGPIFKLRFPAYVTACKQANGVMQAAKNRPLFTSFFWGLP